MATKQISTSEDVLDSRDIIERIEELESEVELDEDERDELAALLALQEEANGVEDWTHGATLIRDSYFEQYAEELADDIGAIDKDASWPCNHIDWKAAAESLQQDYTSVEFDGVTYWVR